MLVDRDLDAARETAAMIAEDGRQRQRVEADITSEADCKRSPRRRRGLGRIDILHNNVGIGCRDRRSPG